LVDFGEGHVPSPREPYTHIKASKQEFCSGDLLREVDMDDVIDTTNKYFIYMYIFPDILFYILSCHF
jgi:hypothetical protein